MLAHQDMRVAVALEWGVNIPADGDVYLYGLEKKVYGLDDEKAILVIDVYEGGTENA